MNPYSGKWNHHYGPVPASEAVGDFRRSLSRVLATVHEGADTELPRLPQQFMSAPVLSGDQM